MRRRFSWLSILGLVLFGGFLLTLDQLTKWLTKSFIPLVAQSVPEYPYGGIGVFRNFLGIEFSINHVTNTGAIWGFFNGHALPLMVLRLLAVAGLIVYFVFGRVHRSWRLPLVMILAGAIGNVFDVFLYGHVVDLFHFRFWGWDYPWFNIADACILLGVACLFVRSWRKKDRAASCRFDS